MADGLAHKDSWSGGDRGVEEHSNAGKGVSVTDDLFSTTRSSLSVMSATCRCPLCPRGSRGLLGLSEL